jgi:arginine-tRNA-protein transferase
MNSVVEYLYEPGGPRPGKCGYCKSPDSSYTRGVWGHRMACHHYQELVDRGFQRSGNYVYKPEMKTTCCPQYVIRMDVKSFKLSKSQRSCVKKFKRYLVAGKKEPSVPTPSQGAIDNEVTSESTCSSTIPVAEPGSDMMGDSSKGPGQPETHKTKIITPGIGPDPNRPPCRKAKLIRKEKKEKKLLNRTSEQGSPTFAVAPSNYEQILEFCQCLKEILIFPKDECTHKFETKLLQINSREFIDSYDESFTLFRKFQMMIHKESESDSGEKQFNEFLVQTPLSYKEGTEKMTTDFGTYHQQYLLDGKIFAVGVLDILPKGVLCEYLYYDPDYRFIAPGVITALMEIAMVQEFYLQNPEMQYYYMGFYVQSCPKMNYKSKYSASKLLCPETYTYISIDKCIPKLKASAYCRLADDDTDKDPHTQYDMGCVPVFADSTAMLYSTYATLHGDQARELLKEYIELVGTNIAFSMTLYLGRC